MAQGFTTADYIVFAAMLLVSAGIGVWYGCGPGGKQTSTKEYLLADRSMRVIPVAISLLVSYLSAITLLGVPSEIYTYGAQYYVLILSYFMICGVVGIIFVPMFRRIHINCVNEVRCFVCVDVLVFLLPWNMRTELMWISPEVILSNRDTIYPWGFWNKMRNDSRQLDINKNKKERPQDNLELCTGVQHNGSR